jgi:hypothetical protein
MVLKHYHPYGNNVGENKCKLLLLPKELLSFVNSTTHIQISIYVTFHIKGNEIK